MIDAALPRDFWNALERAHHVLARLIHNRLARHELTLPQYRALRLLVEHGPHQSQDLAARMGSTAGNLTGVIDRLEQAGWARRDRREDDRRSTTISVTDAGRAKFDAAAPDMRAYVRELLTPLSPEELRAFTGALERLGAHLDRMEADA